MVADRHRDRQRLAAGAGTSPQRRQMMVGGDPDHRPRRTEGLAPCDREIGGGAVRVAGDDRAGGHVRAGLMLEEPRDRQPAQIDRRDLDLPAGPDIDLSRRHRPSQRVEDPRLDRPRIGHHPQTRGDPTVTAQHPADHRQIRPEHPLEQQRRSVVGYGQQRRQLVAQRHRLGDAGQLAGSLQLGQEPPQRLVDVPMASA
jgi:hypothetical protein